MKRIAIDQLEVRPFHLLDQQWALLVAGRDKPNPMTVSWGGLGTLWERPSVIVYVRPTRHTFGLLSTHAEFTLNVMSARQRAALDLCGATSGRDIDKWKAAGLSPVASEEISVPRVEGAELAIECRVLAMQDFDPANFVEAAVQEMYPKRDYHRIFWGEALAVWTNS